MCWTAYNKQRSQPIKAEKDIKVFKIAVITENDNAKPYFMDYSEIVYKTGETYTTNMEPPEQKYCAYVIGKGFHSYNMDSCYYTKGEVNCLVSVTGEVIFHYSRITVNSHYGCSIMNYLTHRTICVMHCTIPEGTTYYENHNGEIVSNAIRVDSIETIK